MGKGRLGVGSAIMPTVLPTNVDAMGTGWAAARMAAPSTGLPVASWRWVSITTGAMMAVARLNPWKRLMRAPLTFTAAFTGLKLRYSASRTEFWGTRSRDSDLPARK